ncbi:LamG-like jellyroll fold domain-containing protein, partial [Candidatus Neomarinimicrobiota bacterium]
GATLTEDRFGNSNSAYSFNGVDDVIIGALSAPSGIDTAITTVAWFYQPAEVGHPGNGVVGVGNGNGGQHFYQRLSNTLGSVIWNGGTGQNRFWIGADDGGSDRWWGSVSGITTGFWHMTATSYSSASRDVKIYIDGVLDRIISLSADLALTDEVYIGCDGYTDNYFVGMIDDIRIYNRALAIAEIQALYIGGPTVDNEGPLISDISYIDNVLEDNPIAITVTVIDFSAVDNVILSYAIGGVPTFYQMTMADQGDNSYKSIIPREGVTRAGVVFFITAEDTLNNTSTSNTVSIPVQYQPGSISTNLANSAFPDGFPYEKWRLISLPSDMDNKTLLGTIQDDFESLPSDSTWKLYSYVGPGSNDYEEVTAFTLGESYFLKQVGSEQAIQFSLGSGKSYDLAGLTITLPSRWWSFVSAPYPFQVDVDVNQSTFIGPYDYGAYGSGGQEGWSLGEVQTTFKPWGGYIVYNNTDATQTLDIAPSAGLGKRLLKEYQEPSAGWTINLTAEGEKYIDGGNVIGRIPGAVEGLDDNDHPEPPYLDGFISIFIDRSDWEDQATRTTDIRSPETQDGSWDLALDTRAEPGPISLTYQLEGDLPPAIALVDLPARKVYRLSARENPAPITAYNEHFSYQLKVVAGSESYVSSTTNEILAALPTDFALGKNYPNPFNPTTTIEYALPRPAKVSLRVYDLLGKEIATLINEWQDMGYRQVKWHGRDQSAKPVASGIYFAVYMAEDVMKVRKMLLLK